jgi:hypothetical protein
MATARRRPWNEMDHDHELLNEEIVLANRVELRGPIPEFLAKKRAERATGTVLAYEVVFVCSCASVTSTASAAWARSQKRWRTISSRPSENVG